MKQYKLEKIFVAYNILIGLKNQRLPIRISYFITKNIDIFEKESKFYQEHVISIYNEYLEQDKNGQYIRITNTNGTQKYKQKDNSKEDEMYDKLKELNDVEIEIEPYIISFEEFLNSNINIMPMELEAISFLFSK